jgi:nucleoside-diphosphate-sugar epimerase
MRHFLGERARIFITGGSGFIGTNLVQHYSDQDCIVLNFDTSSPRNPAHEKFWLKGDICDAAVVREAVVGFRPDIILHAAARTDLDGATLGAYAANTDGVKHMIAAARRAPGLRRILFFSSILVCELGHIPRGETDYCPTTLYGESKVISERLIREIPNTELPWVLARPTSIWGPWFGSPYRSFFEAVRAGWFVLPKGCNSVRSYGYVGNLVTQVEALSVAAPEIVLGRTYHLADYEPLDLVQWANTVSAVWGQPAVRQVPMPLLRTAALFGDVVRALGWLNPPLTSTRLKNLLTSAVFDMSALRKICPVLPVDVDEGVRLTVKWLQECAN